MLKNFYRIQLLNLKRRKKSGQSLKISLKCFGGDLDGRIMQQTTSQYNKSRV